MGRMRVAACALISVVFDQCLQFSGTIIVLFLSYILSYILDDT